MIKVFPSGPFATNAYVVFCPQTLKAAIIDPAPESADDLLDFIDSKELSLEKIILTHSHWDHFGDLKKVHSLRSAPIYVHPLDEKNVVEPGSDGLPQFIPIEGIKPDHYLEEGDKVLIGELAFEVLHTPGHTPGGICLYDNKNHVLISGDTLFKGSIGNLSFPTAEPEKMWVSLDKLAKLPPQTKVYPGHGESTTLQDEPWLKDAKQIFN